MRDRLLGRLRHAHNLARFVDLGRNTGAGALSQGLSSFTNLALVVSVARVETATGFGGFAIAYSVYLVVFGVVRALVGETLSVGSASSDEAAAGRQAMGAAGLLGLGLALLIGGATSIGFTGSAIGKPLVAFSIVLPVALVQDAARFAGFTRNRPSVAVRGDGVWLVVQLLIIGWLSMVGGMDAVLLILVWGSAAIVGTLAMLPSLGPPKFGEGVRWIRSHLGMSGSFGTEFLVQALAGHGTLYVVGFVAGLPAAGALRAAQSLYGPVNSLFMGVGAVLTPQAARAVDEGHRSFALRLALMASVLFGLVAISATLVVVSLPRRVGAAVLGATWEEAQAVVLPIGLVMVGLGVIGGARLGLRAVRAVRQSLYLRVSLGFAGFVMGTAGALFAGVAGAAYGLAVAHLVAAVVGAGMVARFRRHNGPPLSAPV